MLHYELVMMIHPNQSDQASSVTDRYATMVKQSGGTVHRVEDWGNRRLAYPIAKLYKAHYFLMNIECPKELIQELNTQLRFNDSVIRYLLIKTDKAPSGASAMLRTNKVQEHKKRSSHHVNTDADAEETTVVSGGGDNL